MHVIATAGHVDHGKSSLVRALTGIEPDRWAEERRRGMTIDLGFAWTVLPSGEEIAFVDVPGHERFVPNMLAGVGPVPAVMLVVAADSGWMPQTTEHVNALDALCVSHGLVVVTRCDLANGRVAIAEARERLARTSMAGLPIVTASATTGAGLPQVRDELDRLVARLPPNDALAPMRLWIDRSFVIDGAGTVVTGTLGAGTVRVEDELFINAGNERVRVRSIHTLERSVDRGEAGSRVALNLRGVDRDRIQRGDALTGDGPWVRTSVVDAMMSREIDRLPREAVMHIGSAAVAVKVRRMGGSVLRLSLAHPLPLAVADRALLRNPGLHSIVAGVDLLDVEPVALIGRGSARIRAGELAGQTATERWQTELCRRVYISVEELSRLGFAGEGQQVNGWYVDPLIWMRLPERAIACVQEWERGHPLEQGISRAVLIQQLDLPSPLLLEPIVERTSLVSQAGRVSSLPRDHLPSNVEDAICVLEERWRKDPFYSPDVPELRTLKLGPTEQAAAERSGRAIIAARDVILSPTSVDAAVLALLAIPSPFTLSEARLTLATSRRVAVPLLELMDRTGRTKRISADLRTVRARDN